MTARYPELQGLAGVLARSHAVLDGELVVLDDSGRPSFGLLQTRMHADPRKVPSLAATTPVVVMLFDVLAVDGDETVRCPGASGARCSSGSAWPARTGRPRPSGSTARARAPPRSRRPGRSASRASSPSGSTRRYRPAAARRRGARSSSRCARSSSSAAGSPGRDGWRTRWARCSSATTTGPAGRCATRARRLRPRRPDPRPVGRFAAGARHVSLRAASRGDPARGALGRARHRRRGALHEWTADGVLRNPVYLGIRDDVDPAEVVREPTGG